MDQDRREAAAWAAEWQIRHKRNRAIAVIAAVVLIALAGLAVSLITVKVTRTTYSSAEEMREAVQGRYAYERSYEDVVIDGDELTLTYLAMSHYDRDYAERYGYDADKDSVYKDRIVKWDYRWGVLKTEWMGDFVVDKDGNLHRGSYSVFYKTDRPRPEPLDPATLKTPDGSEDVGEDIDEDLKERTDDLTETMEAAAKAGVKPESN